MFLKTYYNTRALFSQADLIDGVYICLILKNIWFPARRDT